MRRWLGMTVGALAALALAGAAQASDPISRDMLERMFAQIRAGSGWDLSKPLLWGYFFLDPDRVTLDRASKVLVERGYRLVAIEQVGDRLWRLHVERPEVHTVDTLDARNREFYAFARAQGLRSYDGMDVGPAS